MKATFIGASWRVQVAIWDIPQQGNLPHSLHFSVSKLPDECHKSTAFSAGIALYYGTSFEAALAIAGNVVRRNILSEIPNRWRTYLVTPVRAA